MSCRHKAAPIASLRDNRAFRQVYQAGRRAAGPLFVIYTFTQEVPRPPRLGLSVNRKVGNAVVRNRVRRLIKESFRLTPPVSGRDYVVVARQAAGVLPCASAFAQVDAALGKLRKRLAATP